MKNNQPSFVDYWKEKAQKRRKSWAAKAKRFAERHMQLAAIRSEVAYSRMDRREVLCLLDEHQTVQNPISRWDPNMHFSFSEQGLREAMQAEGADVSSLTMAVSKKTIVGQQPHEIAYGDMLDLANNRCDLYEKYTDLETCTINYREVTMVIYRYTYLKQPFAMYEFVPCKQLSFSSLRLEETSFSTLNIATLLMEMTAEYELRLEELNYHAKKLRLRTMDAALTADISFELWDDKKLEKKVSEYIDKNYPVEKMLEFVLRPWKQAITKYFRDITEQEINNSTEKFHVYNLKYSHDFSALYIKDVLQPFFNKHGLAGIKMWIPDKECSPLFMESQGCQAKYDPWDDAFYPNAHYSMCCIFGELNNTPLHALTYYLQKMPKISKKTDEVVIKVMHLYDRMMRQKHENYCRNVDLLDTLATQHAGTPVGKMMKYLRWNAGRFVGPSKYAEFSIPTLKVLGDNSFSFIEKKYLQGISKVNGQQPRASQDEVRERWLDADSQTVYVAEPDTTDFDEWMKAHRRGIFVERFSWPVKDFLNIYSKSGSGSFLSIDFINQNL